MVMEATPVNVPITLGAIEIGIILNTFLFGIVVIQLYNYYTAGFKDGWKHHCLIWWTFTLDLTQTIIVSELLWKYTVNEFGIYGALMSSQWEYTTSPIFISSTSIPIQLFLATRVQRMSTPHWFGNVFLRTIQITCISQAFLAIYMTSRTLQGTQTVDDYKFYIVLASAWTGVDLATDLSISMSLIFILLLRRTGFRTTDSMIIRIITVTVETAIPVTVFAIGHLIAIRLGTTTGIHDLFAIPLGRLYTNTFLMTLNSRKSFRAVSQSLETTGIRFGMPPIDYAIAAHGAAEDTYSTQVRIEVSHEQSMKMDSDTEVPKDVDCGEISPTSYGEASLKDAEFNVC